MNDFSKSKQFNTQTYRFEISLLPYDAEPVILNPDAVVQLVLEEELTTWYRKGMLIFQNGYESFERSLSVKKAQGTVKAATLRSMNTDGYIFRNDGKDRINIKIKPIKNENSVLNMDEVPDSTWLIDFTGNIYDFEEPMVSELGSKVRRIYFWDENFQKMLEKDLTWSTATSVLNDNKQGQGYDPQNATDDQRKMYTGDAIKDILKNVMKMDVDETNFDKGSTKIFHTAATDSNVWENLQYLLAHHYASVSLKSENQDVCVFLFDKATQKFSLMPLSKIFQKAGKNASAPKEYQIEHLILEDIGTIQPAADKLWMAPLLEKYDPEIDVKIAKLKKYAFSDMAGVDSMKDMVTTAIHAYDRKNKTFTKCVERSSIQDIPNNLKTDYIEDFLFYKTPQTLINMNKIKKTNLKVNNEHTPIADRLVLGRLGHGNLILKSILLNLCLTVEMEGSTHRKPARFIGVDRLANNNTEFDYKLGGQWFIVKVTHNFFRNTYVNEVVCVKPQVYDKIDVKEDIE